jgi:dTDP-4-amino-4,6-dideoxygalactose transaminase
VNDADRPAIEGGLPVSPRTIPIAAPRVPPRALRQVVRLLRVGQLRDGPLTRQFERRFAVLAGARHGVAVSSGTAALHLAFAMLLAPGEEVVVPAFTFFATAAGVVLAGGVPVLADIDPETYTLDPRSAATAMSARTRALAPVHLFGHPADLPALQRVASGSGAALVADAAQAHGARLDGRGVAALAAVSTYSFYVTKNLFTGEGGMIVTDDASLAERAAVLRNQGQRTRYVHEVFGFNYRITEPASAIGLSQLDGLPRANRNRARNAAALTRRLSGVPGIVVPSVRAGVEHVWHQYTIRVSEGAFRIARDAFVDALRAEGIEPGVHYPIAVHAQPAMRERFGELGPFPHAERAAREVLSLPVHPQLTRTDVDRVATAVEKLAAYYRA